MSFSPVNCDWQENWFPSLGWQSPTELTTINARVFVKLGNHYDTRYYKNRRFVVATKNYQGERWQANRPCFAEDSRISASLQMERLEGDSTAGWHCRGEKWEQGGLPRRHVDPPFQQGNLRHCGRAAENHNLFSSTEVIFGVTWTSGRDCFSGWGNDRQPIQRPEYFQQLQGIP